MKQLLLSILLAFSVSSAFAADKVKNKPMTKCTADYIPITLKTKDGKSYTAFVNKDDAKKLHKAKALEANCNSGFCKFMYKIVK